MKNPFVGVTDPEKLVKIYNVEKYKALNLSSSRHSIWKINLLQEQLKQAQDELETTKISERMR